MTLGHWIHIENEIKNRGDVLARLYFGVWVLNSLTGPREICLIYVYVTVLDGSWDLYHLDDVLASQYREFKTLIGK